MITINTSGKSVKDAAAITKAALDKQKDQNFGEVQVFVDDTMSAFEIKKILEAYGLDVLIQDEDGLMTLVGSVKGVKNDYIEQGSADNKNISGVELENKLEDDNKLKELKKEFKLEDDIKNDYKNFEDDLEINLKNNGNYKLEKIQDTKLKVEQSTVFLIMGKSLGRGDIKLGEILIKGFLAGLVKSETAPDAVILLNEGVKLALFDSSTCDHLKDLEARGTQILISGVCTSHFGITDNIGAGVISNIYEIVDVINRAGKVVSL